MGRKPRSRPGEDFDDDRFDDGAPGHRPRVQPEEREEYEEWRRERSERGRKRRRDRDRERDDDDDDF